MPKFPSRQQNESKRVLPTEKAAFVLIDSFLSEYVYDVESRAGYPEM